ncbi:MAG: DUF1573 domain-containing protein [Chitinophagaceae bacterium]
MKKIVLAFAALTISATMMAQTAAVPASQTAATVVAAPKASDYIKFKEIVHDFGKIKQNEPVTFEFIFANISDKPLVIESATASCGCTTPVKPEAPIAKGKSDKITAGFNAAQLGIFNKIIYVKLAGIDIPMELKITGNVLTTAEYAKYELDKSKKSK